MVHLDPATPYSAAVFRALAERQRDGGFFTEEKETATVSPNTVMFKCRRSVSANAEGRFSFPNVAPGPYILSSYMRWMKPHGDWVGVWNIKTIGVRADGSSLNDVVLNGAPQTVQDPPKRH
jgi:hypothetical protein